LQSDKFHPFPVVVRRRASNPEEIKHRSAKTKAEAIYSLIEAESKDLLEPERMKAVKNLQLYRNEMRASRDWKVKQRNIELET
jgi:hypothetical protein